LQGADCAVTVEKRSAPAHFAWTSQAAMGSFAP
jgi:hypothetical protein